jgi:MinD-like ATPase involved in chromosome partitioning or flagellar assembly
MTMRIVNFYSFKGGVGRSLTLVNVAFQLSQKGQRVGLIDLDVEAGGLNHILRIRTSSNRDLLALLAPSNRDISNLEGHVHEIQFRAGEASRVFLLPTVTDSHLLDQISWNSATQHFISSDLVPAFRRLYSLDYLLIDSRSGITASAALGLTMADLEVLVCRLDSQNRYGIKRIVEVCRAASKPFKIVVCACPPSGRKQHVKRFEKEVGAQVDYMLPYLADLYYDEFIISQREPDHPLAKEYKKLASDIHRNLS